MKGLLKTETPKNLSYFTRFYVAVKVRASTLIGWDWLEPKSVTVCLFKVTAELTNQILIHGWLGFAVLLVTSRRSREPVMFEACIALLRTGSRKEAVYIKKWRMEERKHWEAFQKLHLSTPPVKDGVWEIWAVLLDIAGLLFSIYISSAWAEARYSLK